MEPAERTVTRMQIGEVAERVALSLRTVRYYEEQGLIEPESRSDGGFRLYTDAQVQKLLLIKQMKPLGFTVAEMRELIVATEEVAATDRSATVRAAALVRLQEFTADAAERCATLGEQLRTAEAFAARLREETERAARSTGDPRRDSGTTTAG